MRGQANLLKQNNLVHLQNIGDVPGTPAKDLKPGDKLMWNWGYICEVLSIEFTTSKKSVYITERYTGNMGTFDTIETTRRRLGANRLTAKVN